MNTVESSLLTDLTLMKRTNACPGNTRVRHSDTEDILRFKQRTKGRGKGTETVWKTLLKV